MRVRFGVLVERTVLELRGLSCLDLEEGGAAAQKLSSSKSFGSMVHTYDELAEAVTALEEIKSDDCQVKTGERNKCVIQHCAYLVAPYLMPQTPKGLSTRDQS